MYLHVRMYLYIRSDFHLARFPAVTNNLVIFILFRNESRKIPLSRIHWFSRDYFNSKYFDLESFTEVNPKRVIHHEGHFLNIQFETSRRVTQRVASEIMKIFLTEVLGYTGVGIVEKDDNFNASEVFERLSERPTYTEYGKM